MAKRKRNAKARITVLSPEQMREVRDGTVKIDALARARISKADLEPVYDTAGTDTGAKRRTNVFRALRTPQGPLTPNQSAYGVKLAEIYARWRGAAGTPDDDLFIPLTSDSAPDLVTDRMVEAGKTWREIMRFVGPTSARILTAICEDIVFGDGAFVVANASGKPAVRWRKVVEKITGDGDRNRQSVYIHNACKDLEQYWK